MTKAVLIDLQDYQTNSIGERILSELGIPLKKGMTVEDIEVILEGAPFTTTSFLKDRKEYEYRKDDGSDILISCVVHDRTGLIHVSIVVE